MSIKESQYIMADLVHSLQRERGCVAIFLYSQGGLFADRMCAQFPVTDTHIMLFRDAFEEWKQAGAFSEFQIRKLRQLVEQFLELDQWRKKAQGQEVVVSDAIGYYSHQLVSPLIQNMVELALYMEGSDPANVSAYSAFLQWKERIGLERAITARGFIGRSFHNEELVERLAFLLSEQGSYRNTYLALANDKQKRLVREALEQCGVSERIEQLHTALQVSPGGTIVSDMTPESWFDLVSAKIDALHSIERQLADTLTASKDNSEVSEVQAARRPANTLGEYTNLVMSLPLFTGLSDDTLNTLLQHGQIREFHKGKMLFLEGEQANRLYIILRGWVKLLKGTAGGEEAILQMLSSGDSIMESAVFLNTVLPVSAQIAEDTTLLSLPAPVLREQIKSNNELAMNLLAAMSMRSQGLIRQIESARLKSVDERIGWFLLKLLLDQGRISRCIELPYDKALIASYLDMKRETFSRSLKRLKEKGFKIENDTVIMPDLKALCSFCDSDTAQQCAQHETSECPAYETAGGAKQPELKNP